MNQLEKLWAGDFGDQYHKRCRVQWTKRIPFWKSIIDMTGARSVHEVGCGPGWNLSAIRRAYPDVHVSGNDTNGGAVNQGNAAGLSLTEGTLSEWVTGGADLVMTVGCLIHIGPDDLQQTMQDIIDASFDWVLAVEYYAPEPIEVHYRGQDGALWKRPYGDLYQKMGLKHVQSGMLIDADGFDACTWGLLRKPA